MFCQFFLKKFIKNDNILLIILLNVRHWIITIIWWLFCFVCFNSIGISLLNYSHYYPVLLFFFLSNYPCSCFGHIHINPYYYYYYHSLYRSLFYAISTILIYLLILFYYLHWTMARTLIIFQINSLSLKLKTKYTIYINMKLRQEIKFSYLIQ